MSKLYALLVGINDYPEPTRKLGGCLNDLGNAHDYLKTAFPEAAIVVLKDSEATRANVIGQFRTHLGQAGSDDVAMFQYCGHGAPTSAAPEFHAFDLGGRDQGLVLFDSRVSDATSTPLITAAWSASNGATALRSRSMPAGSAAAPR